ncbi:sigma-70 family RNA polymerase sigma factor [bacterium]|nr:sigma-70 family RNA polymerase sigma factor [bacterium]RQV98539.1 MAG: sigma-70 family RNA polymerase sigma factor [bacterium]
MEKIQSDAHLIQSYLSGRERAFEKLLKRYERPLFSFIFRFVGDRQSAEDLFQQTWFKVIQGLPRYKERGSFSSWLFGIANNGCIDFVRKHNRAKRNDLVSGEGMEQLKSDEHNQMDRLLRKEKTIWLEKAIEQLPPDQKQVVLLRIYSELPFKEIARILNDPLNTVLGRMHYAVQNLKKIAKEEYGEVENR